MSDDKTRWRDEQLRRDESLREAQQRRRKELELDEKALRDKEAKRPDPDTGKPEMRKQGE